MRLLIGMIHDGYLFVIVVVEDVHAEVNIFREVFLNQIRCNLF